MSYPLSDEESTDSESGIRFKTDSTRKTFSNFSAKEGEYSCRRNKRDDYTSRSESSRSKRRHHNKDDRNYSRDRYKRSRTKSRSRSRERRRSKSHKSHKQSKHRKKYKSDDDDCVIIRHSVDRNSSKDRTDQKKENEEVKIISSVAKKYETNNKKTGNINETGSYGPSVPSCSSKIEKDNSKHNNDESEEKTSGLEKTDRNNQLYGPNLPSKKNKSNSGLENKETIDNIYGPILPSLTSKEKNIENNSECLTTNETCANIVPEQDRNINNSEKSSSLPQVMSDDESFIYGPVLPSQVKNLKSTIENQESINVITDEESKDTENNLLFGPALPPHLQQQDTAHQKQTENEETIIGPSIPAHLRKQLQDDINQPTIIHHSDSDDDMIGPVPEGHISISRSHKLLEERALEIKLNSLNPSETKSVTREEWMTELPSVQNLTSLGLSARQFRTKIGPDLSDRSVWTDTPQDKEKKKTKKDTKTDIKMESKLKEIKKRDQEQEEIVKKHKKKKKRDKALIELHQEKLKKEKKDSKEPPERRPFDRDIDLKVNRFDNAQKQAILKKAQLLDTRFSSGEAKFL